MLSKASAAIAVLMMNTQEAQAGFISGLNMPWGQCGNDFGVAYSADDFEARMSKYEKSGAETFRYWIHFDANKQL